MRNMKWFNFKQCEEWLERKGEVPPTTKTTTTKYWTMEMKLLHMIGLLYGK